MLQYPKNTNRPEVFEHQQKEINGITAMRTGIAECNPHSGKTRSGSVTGAKVENPLHKAGRKLIDTLVAHHGKEGAQRILTQRIKESKAKQLMESVTLIAKVVRTFAPPTPQQVIDFELHQKVVRYLQHYQVQQRIRERRIERADAAVQDVSDAFVPTNEQLSHLKDMVSSGRPRGMATSMVHMDTVGFQNGNASSDIDDDYGSNAGTNSDDLDDEEAASDITYALKV